MATLPEQVTAALRERYRLDRELGRGGMATVYLARDLRHDRSVALKILHPELAATLGPDRFVREIRVIAQLQHPHILPLHDSGEAAGFLYYVMPYVEGESLRQRLLREAQLPLDEAVRLAREIAEALDHAHERGIVHRDIKPENILLSQGHALVADFGIALAVAQAAEVRLTETGLSLGTPAYMSPEQASAETRLDGRSDQYSLACTVYEMLAGEPPYTGASAQAVIAKRLSDPVPRLGTLRQVPAGVEAAVTRALAKAPADRFPKTTAFTSALLAGAQQPAPPYARRVSRLLPAAIGALAVLVAFAVASRTRRAATGLLESPPVQRQFTFTAQAREPTLAPDERSVAYVLGRQSLVVEPLAGGDPVELARAAGWIAHPRWSPDGEWLYFTMLADPESPVAIYRVASRGGTPTRLVGAVGPVDLSPDGRTIVRRAGNELVFHQAATGAEQARVPIPGTDSSTGLAVGTTDFSLDVAWSPDGQWIASTTDWFGGDIVVTSIHGQHGIVAARSRDGPVRWTPTGDGLVYLSASPGGADLVQLPFDTRRGVVTGSERSILSAIPRRLSAEAVFDLGRADRSLVYTGGAQSQHLWVFDLVPGRDTAAARRLSRDSRAYDWPALSRDGSEIAVLQLGLEGWPNGNYFVLPSTGGDFKALTSGPGYKSNPGWAPDGTRLAYALTDSTGSRLILSDRSGRRASIGMTPPFPVAFFRIGWSADGRRLLYPAVGGKALVALDVARGTESLSVLPDSSGMWLGAALSPDGVSYVATELHRWAEPFRLLAAHIGDSTQTVLHGPPGANMPLVWREDGWVYLYNDADQDERVGRATRRPSIWRMRPDGSRQQRVAWLPAECRFGFVTMSGDARRVACAVLHQEPDVWLVSGSARLRTR